MKNSIERTPLLKNLTPEQRDLLLGLFLLLIVAGLYYAQWAYSLSFVIDSKVNIFNPQKFFWWADDSREYRATGDWLFGKSEDSAIERRPWLYPLLTGFARKAFAKQGETVLWTAQILMWLGSLVFLYLALFNATKKIPLAILGSTLFFSHPSVLVLTFHGMTETLNILFLSILVWLLSTQKKHRLLYALLIFSLLTVTKPTYQVQLGLLSLYFILRNLKMPRLKLAGILALVLLPVWIQMALTLAHSGRPSVSNIGTDTFKKFFVAVVYAHTEGLEWRESLAVIEDWDLGDQLGYLAAHPRETILTYRDNLIDRNLWIGSFFIRGEDNRMIGFANSFNALSLYVHLLMLPLVCYYLLSPRYTRHKELLALVYLTFAIQTLVTGISTGQEDRLIITGVPLWIFAYLLVVHNFVSLPEPTGT
jgi:hypothetical protein